MYAHTVQFFLKALSLCVASFKLNVCACTRSLHIHNGKIQIKKCGENCRTVTHTGVVGKFSTAQRIKIKLIAKSQWVEQIFIWFCYITCDDVIKTQCCDFSCKRAFIVNKRKINNKKKKTELASVWIDDVKNVCKHCIFRPNQIKVFSLNYRSHSVVHFTSHLISNSFKWHKQTWN